jgi:hypothetical protein
MKPFQKMSNVLTNAKSTANHLVLKASVGLATFAPFAAFAQQTFNIRPSNTIGVAGRWSAAAGTAVQLLWLVCGLVAAWYLVQSVLAARAYMKDERNHPLGNAGKLFAIALFALSIPVLAGYGLGFLVGQGEQTITIPQQMY